MASAIQNIIRNSGIENTSPMALTQTQTDMLTAAGLTDPSTKEYKDAALKFQVQNLANSVAMANELLQAFSEMRKKSTEGMSR